MTKEIITPFYDRNDENIVIHEDEEGYYDDMHIARALSLSENACVDGYTFLLRQMLRTNVALKGTVASFVKNRNLNKYYRSQLVQLIIQADMVLGMCGDME